MLEPIDPSKRGSILEIKYRYSHCLWYYDKNDAYFGVSSYTEIRLLHENKLIPLTETTKLLYGENNGIKDSPKNIQN